MRGVIVTGPLGVGKSTLQRRLVDERGFWTPVTVCTRADEQGDTSLLSVPEADLIAGVQAGEFVLPMRFGGAWYAWRSRDLARLQGHSPQRAVLNVRPYTALALGACLEGLVPVWLRLPAHELAERRSQRGAKRDRQAGLAQERRVADDVESAYQALFHYQLIADELALDSLERLAESA